MLGTATWWWQESERILRPDGITAGTDTAASNSSRSAVMPSPAWALRLGSGGVIGEHRLTPGRGQNIALQPQVLRRWHPDAGGCAGSFAGFNVLDPEVAPVGHDFDPARLKVPARRSQRFGQQPQVRDLVEGLLLSDKVVFGQPADGHRTHRGDGRGARFGAVRQRP